MTAPPEADPGDAHWTLLADHTLAVSAPAAARALVEEWLPRNAQVASHDVAAAAPSRIVVREGDWTGAADRAGATHLLTLGGLEGYAVGESRVILVAGDGRVTGSIELARGQADIASGGATAREHVPVSLTLAAALLLGRRERALVHGAALVAPDDRVWLLVGDSHAGKTTTCATMLDAGWRYCSDDQVVVGRDAAGCLTVEGWPRVFHLDAGFARAEPAGGVREDVRAEERWPGRWLARAPLGGVLLPRVAGDEASALLPADGADRLTAVVRQSPWLFADAVAAPAMLALLRDMALLPGHGLRLGRDTFSNPDRLRAVLAPLG